MKILFAPAHYYLTDTTGSELSWAFNLVDRIGSIYPDSEVIVGKNSLSRAWSKCKIYQVMPEISNNPSPIESLAFNWRYSSLTKKKLREGSYNILHHVLPFRLGFTFNRAILDKGRSLPAVIGPFQNPLEYIDRDFAQHSGSSFLSELSRSAQGLASPVLAHLSRQTLRRAQRVVAINPRSRELLIMAGVAERHIVEIPPGIDLSKFKMPKRSIRRGRPVRFISAGYLIARKGFDVLIKAAKVLSLRKLEFELIIAGGGPREKELKQSVKTAKLERVIKFLGQLPQGELIQQYAQADVFILMSRSESWGQVYIEAMALGLPIISSQNYGANSIIVNHENTGYLVAQEDYRALASHMEKLILNPNLRLAMAKRARSVVERRYDWDNEIIPQYLEIYERIIKEAKQ